MKPIKPLIRDENKLIKVVSNMATRGIGVDMSELTRQRRKVSTDLLETQEILDNIAEEPFNCKSNPQIKRVCEAKGWKYIVNPKTNNIMADKYTLNKYKNYWPQEFLSALKTYRVLSKVGEFLETTYKHCIQDEEGRYKVHPSYYINGCVTGRFSVKSPAMQTLPKIEIEDSEDTESESKALSVRKCFTARIGSSFVAIDYSQQEYRLLLDYLGYKPLIEAVNSGLDIHQVIADSLKVSREKAKAVNFSILYGAGIKSLSLSLGMTEGDTRVFLQRYYDRIPPLKNFVQTVRRIAERRGYIQNWKGRVLKLAPELSYRAINYLIQSSGADIIKTAMVSLMCPMTGTLRNRPGVHLVCQIHDELLFEVSDLSIINEIMDQMSKSYKPFNGIKMKVTASVGHSFAKGHLKEHAG